MCVSSFFAGKNASTYAQNRYIDQILCAFGWDRFEALIQAAGLPRKSRLLKKCHEMVRRAQTDWPALMDGFPTPVAVKTEIMERLCGKVAIAA